jgi:hypothetical protein
MRRPGVNTSARVLVLAVLLGSSVGAGPPSRTTASPRASAPPRNTAATAPTQKDVWPWPLREGPYHGSLDRIAFGAYGELRIAEDRVRGVTDPEWFSFGRVGGFASVKLSNRFEVLGEGAYDQGPDDFSLENADLRFRLNRTMQLHGGIFLVPLGHTNLWHDGPSYEFAERSLPATQLIGVPNAQAGIGLRGVGGHFHGSPLSYEVAVVTGYDDGVVMDGVGGTRVPMGRNNYGDNNGVPALAARVALHPSPTSEIGIAGQSGKYNETVLGGVTIDHSRYLHIFVADASTRLAGIDLFSEGVMALIDVPSGLEALYAQQQWGVSIEATRTLREPIFAGWTHSRLTGALRLDAVDFDPSIYGDSRSRLSASLNLRHQPLGVIRLGWYYEIARDRFNNSTPKAGATMTAAAYF